MEFDTRSTHDQDFRVRAGQDGRVALVLVVEDERDIREVLRRYLEREAHGVLTCGTGAEGLRLLREADPDLVLLDLGLPDIDGLEILDAATATHTPVIALTARAAVENRIEGLQRGADDYVTKPFSPRELAARIRAMRRRPRVTTQQEVRDFGRLVVDPVAREVKVDGEDVELTKIEFDILDLLSSSPRRTFTREQLLVQVWGEWFGDDHVIEVHMGKLRKKLGESASQPRHIRTLRGVGYRFEPS